MDTCCIGEKKKPTFRDIVSKYVHYVDSNYGQCTVVFDGYGENASTKDHEHNRRLLKAKGTPNMSVELENRFADVTQKSFFNNSKNKQNFINLLSDVVVHRTGDADIAVVPKVLVYACACNSVKLIGADTELLIMLLYFWNSEMAEITMLSEPTKKNEGIVRSISRIAESISDIRKSPLSLVSVDVTQYMPIFWTILISIPYQVHELLRYAY